jgi:DNA-binding transcriptional ArsR family regulator
MEIDDAVRLCKAAGERNRMRVLAALLERRACVCELAEALALGQPNCSRHLRVLEDAGLVKHTRRGPWVDYAVVRRPGHAGLLRLVKTVAARDEGMKKDAAALAAADRRVICTRPRPRGAKVNRPRRTK